MDLRSHSAKKATQSTSSCSLRSHLQRKPRISYKNFDDESPPVTQPAKKRAGRNKLKKATFKAKLTSRASKKKISSKKLLLQSRVALSSPSLQEDDELQTLFFGLALERREVAKTEAHATEASAVAANTCGEESISSPEVSPLDVQCDSCNSHYCYDKKDKKCCERTPQLVPSTSQIEDTINGDNCQDYVPNVLTSPSLTTDTSSSENCKEPSVVPSPDAERETIEDLLLRQEAMAKYFLVQQALQIDPECGAMLQELDELKYTNNILERGVYQLQRTLSALKLINAGVRDILPEHKVTKATDSE